ncbi:MFS transporter [Stutzerimonas kirkiae]|uniref:MFS transporter n=1 Tax=Stutzerimonas kirkiae TaxID=2211392 RepID=UPI00103844E7|nr:MFS transporter [Stutzerimonas kirkiae]TBV15780.1 MFS transporter [Stutzerimonas kirkiae]
MSPSRPAFLVNFMLLATFSGATIGMAKIVTTLYAIEIGANAMQIGIISAMEALGMILLTLPAGFVIARYGARRVYFLASLGPLLLNLAIPLFGGWLWLAIARLLIGLCIPFRIVAMNSAFLQRLRHIGHARAGWYRGSLTLGMGLLGPLLGHWLSGGAGFTLGFVAIGLCFGAMAFYSLGFWEAAAPGPELAEQPAGGMLAQTLAMLGHVEIAESCLVEMLSGATNALFATFILLLAMDIAGLSQAQAVSLVMVQGLATVLGLFGFGRLVARRQRRFTYLCGLLAALLGLALLGRSHDYWLLAGGAVLLSAATALVHLINMAQLSEHGGDKSKVSGLFNLASMLGGFAGALLGGALSQWLGLHNLFLAWMPLVLLAAAYCWWRKQRRSTGTAVVEG